MKQPANSSQQRNSSIIRIFYAGKRDVAGCGFYLGGALFITCAHVIKTALGLKEHSVARPQKLVNLDFPLLDISLKEKPLQLKASIHQWVYDGKSLDIAILKIKGKLPEQVLPAKLFYQFDKDIEKDDVLVFGYPNGNEAVGGWNHGIVMSKVGDGLFQIYEKQGYPIQPGYSGSPVWDEQLNAIIGMISQAHIENRTGFMLPLNQIRLAWPPLNALITIQKADILYQQKLLGDFFEQLDQIENAHLADLEVKKYYLEIIVGWGKELYVSGKLDFSYRLFDIYDQLEPGNPETALWLEKISNVQKMLLDARNAYEQEQWQIADEKITETIRCHNQLDEAKELSSEVNGIKHCIDNYSAGRLADAFNKVYDLVEQFPASAKVRRIFNDVYVAYSEKVIEDVIISYLDLDQLDKCEDYSNINENLNIGLSIIKKVQQNPNLKDEDGVLETSFWLSKVLNIAAETLDERRNHNWFHDFHLLKELLNAPDRLSVVKLFNLQALLESEISKWIITPNEVDLRELDQLCSNISISYQAKPHGLIADHKKRLDRVIEAVQIILSKDLGDTYIQLRELQNVYPKSSLLLILIRNAQIKRSISQIRQYAKLFYDGNFDLTTRSLEIILDELNSRKLSFPRIKQAAFQELQKRISAIESIASAIDTTDKFFRDKEYERAANTLKELGLNDYTKPIYYAVRYLHGKQLSEKQDWFKAFYVFDEVVKFDYLYKQASELLERCTYERAESLVKDRKFKEAKTIFQDLPDKLSVRPEIKGMKAKLDFLERPENQEIELLFDLPKTRVSSLEKGFDTTLKAIVVKQADSSIKNKNYGEALNLLNKARNRYSEDKKLKSLHTQARSGLIWDLIGKQFARFWFPVAVGLIVIILIAKIVFPTLFPLPILSVPTSTISVQNIATETSTPTSTPIPYEIRMNSCNPPQAIPDIPIGNRMIRWEGVSSFSVENSPSDTLLNNHVRSLYVDEGGAWLGYFSSDPGQIGGLSHFNHAVWENCNFGSGLETENINDILKDPKGRLWIATEAKGVYQYDGKEWRSFKGLPSEKTYGLSTDNDGAIWVATWEGVARFNEKDELWNTIYSTEKGTLSNNHIHEIAFTPSGDIWIGFVGHGVDRFNNQTGQWEHYETVPGGLCGEKTRRIVVRNNPETQTEEIWFATVDGGVCQFSNNIWTGHELPAKVANDIQVDSLNRVWVSTDAGTFYWDNDIWNTYTTIASDAIAFGPDCADCPFTTDDVLVGTKSLGMLHAKLPLDNMVEILDACFVVNGQRQCGQISEATAQKVTIKTKQTLLPGQKVIFELVVSPRSPYKLQSGDFLSFVMQDESFRYGAYLLIPVKESVLAGQKYTLTDVDNPFIVPSVASGETKVFSNLWRIWMDGRYAGPIIQIELSVNLPLPSKTPSPTPRSTATPTPTPTALVKKDPTGHLMVYIPAGKFSMGSENGQIDEKPVHEVFLNDYYIDQFEVTNAQYRKCAEEKDSGCDLLTDNFRFQNTTGDYRNHPVVSVTWAQAETFCEWRGGRLPTEAEWEKAARGNTSNVYPWGNTKPTCDIALFGGCFKNSSNRLDTMPVGSHPNDLSIYNVYDMGGSVIEWIWDWYSENYYTYFMSLPFPDPMGPDIVMPYRVTRGGGWSPDGIVDTNRMRVSDRGYANPTDRYVNFGFRCVIKP